MTLLLVALPLLAALVLVLNAVVTRNAEEKYLAPLREAFGHEVETEISLQRFYPQMTMRMEASRRGTPATFVISVPSMPEGDFSISKAHRQSWFEDCFQDLTKNTGANAAIQALLSLDCNSIVLSDETLSATWRPFDPKSQLLGAAQEQAARHFGMIALAVKKSFVEPALSKGRRVAALRSSLVASALFTGLFGIAGGCFILLSNYALEPPTLISYAFPIALVSTYLWKRWATKISSANVQLGALSRRLVWIFLLGGWGFAICLLTGINNAFPQGRPLSWRVNNLQITPHHGKYGYTYSTRVWNHGSADRELSFRVPPEHSTARSMTVEVSNGLLGLTWVSRYEFWDEAPPGE